MQVVTVANVDDLGQVALGGHARGEAFFQCHPVGQMHGKLEHRHVGVRTGHAGQGVRDNARLTSLQARAPNGNPPEVYPGREGHRFLEGLQVDVRNDDVEVLHRKSQPGTPPSCGISVNRVTQGHSGHTHLCQQTLFDPN